MNGNDPGIKQTIANYINADLQRNRSASISELIIHFNEPSSIKESEPRYVVNHLLYLADVVKFKTGTMDDYDKMRWCKNYTPSSSPRTDMKIVMSHSWPTELGLKLLKKEIAFRKQLYVSGKSLVHRKPFSQFPIVSGIWRGFDLMFEHLKPCNMV